MKQFLLTVLSFSLVIGASAQFQRATAPSWARNIAVQKPKAMDEITNMQTTVNPYVASRDLIQNEIEIGQTVYDLQSNGSTPTNRMEVFSDGTIGATWTRGTGPAAYADRGTGYNYFDGAAWGPAPTNRVEAARSGWPAYAACGPTGEAFVSHISGTTGLNFYKREVKGTGDWVATTVAPPSGATGLLWPRMTSSGANNEILHVIALTAPVANGGAVYEGQDGAIVYIRSTDAGETWETPIRFDEMGPDFYVAFGGDSYSLEAVGSNIVLLITDNWMDMFAMVSHDDGATWEQIIIWEHPIPLWNNTPSIDSIYCPDGSGHATFDRDGKLHVAFGVNRGLFEEGETAPSWFPWVDGLAYWNEDMEPWVGGADQADVLNPDLLYESGNLIGYMFDLNGNGQLDLLGFEIANLGLYYVSPSSMPQIIVDDNNDIFVVYSGITETFDNGAQQYRHLWLRHTTNAGAEWAEPVHVSADLVHMFDECVFPSMARENGPWSEKLYVLYQADTEPGLAIRGDEDTPTDNYFYFTEITKPTVGAGNNPLPIKEMQISAAYPNPFSGNTSIDVTTYQKSNVSVEVYNITGQKVMEQSYGVKPAGMFKLDVNASALCSGMYLVKVKAGEQASTARINVL